LLIGQNGTKLEHLITCRSVAALAGQVPLIGRIRFFNVRIKKGRTPWALPLASIKISDKIDYGRGG
jgi:hypothetical protein